MSKAIPPMIASFGIATFRIDGCGPSKAFVSTQGCAGFSWIVVSKSLLWPTRSTAYGFRSSAAEGEARQSTRSPTNTADMVLRTLDVALEVVNARRAIVCFSMCGASFYAP